MKASVLLQNTLHYTVDEMSTDQLTMLFNRPTAKCYLREYINYVKENHLSFTTVLININDITLVNKEYGHKKGDQLIRYVAKILINSLQDLDFAARFSGDEFLLLFKHNDKVFIHEQLQEILRKLSIHQTEHFELSFCYGIRCVSEDETIDAKQLISECDDIMYRWKRLYAQEKLRVRSHHVYRESEEVKRFSYDETLLLRTLMQSTDDYIYVCDMMKEPSVFRYSEAMVKEFGFPSEVVHHAADIWLEHIHEDDREAFLEANQEIVDGCVNHHHVEFRAKNIQNKWVWLRCRGYVERNMDGEPIFFAGFISNLERKNKIDPLTGLFNKFEFEDTIEQITKNAMSTEFVVMQLDLDGFSSINKLYDHHFGDLVLAKTAHQIQALLPSDARMYRNDGDEFLILFFHDLTKAHIASHFEKIQSCLKSQQDIAGRHYYITMSAGVAKYPIDGDDVMSITKSMSHALETSKHKGKNCITFFEKDMLANELRELTMIEQMRYATEHEFKGFEVYFQPLVNADNGNVIGAEALARFHCDLYGCVPPVVFIPLLERTGMIIQVGKWIFQQAVEKCSAWLHCNSDFHMSINLSYLQLTDHTFVDFIKCSMRENNVPSKNIIVEMTESQLMKDDVLLHEIFSSIRETGIQIAMDDFGTGYSSLGVLKRSPADIVKIDRVFVKDILHSNFDATFIRFIVSLCHDVNIRVLLEGVETKEEYEKVRAMGLDYIQGYYFGKPMKANQFQQLLRT